MIDLSRLLMRLSPALSLNECPSGQSTPQHRADLNQSHADHQCNLASYSHFELADRHATSLTPDMCRIVLNRPLSGRSSLCPNGGFGVESWHCRGQQFIGLHLWLPR